MRKHLRKPGVWIAALLMLAIWLLRSRPASSPLPQPVSPAAVGATREAPDQPASAPRAGLPPLPAFLPAEAQATIALILRDGPYPHAQDDGVFGNHEGHLPDRPRGYYREYTVPTTGLDHRGTRRIVTGGDPPEVWYYTDDHYDSFRQFTIASQGRP
jgi:guanyl-specific ribonuclease Sa